LWAAGAVLLVGAVVLTLVAVVVRAGGAEPVGAVAPPPKPVPTLTVVTWNVCADTWRSCPYGGRPTVTAGAVVDTVRRQRADVVLLQEVCRSVLTPVAAALGDGWTVSFQPVYRASRTRKGERVKQARCADNLGEYGLATLARRDLGTPGDPGGTPGDAPAPVGAAAGAPAGAPVTAPEAGPVVSLHPLPSPRPVTKKSIEQRLAMCLELGGPRLRVCNAHFSIRDQDPTGALRARQAEQLAQEMWFGERLGYATLVGGDFNASPAGTVTPGGREILGPLYESGTECEDAAQRRPTYGTTKIDYLFAGRGFTRVSCAVLERPESDHRVLVGRFRPGPPSAEKQAAEKPAAKGADGEGTVADGAVAGDEPAGPRLRNAFLTGAGTRDDGGALASALGRGAAGLEVEARARGGAIVLGAAKADPWRRTLDGSYLRPLRRWIAARGGAVDPRSPTPFTLLVNLGPEPDRAAYEALERALHPYRGMLFRLDAGREVRAAVRVVVPDSRALREHLTTGAGRSTSYLFVEAGEASGGGAGLPRDAVAVVSVRLPGLAGLVGGADAAVLERQVRRVHERGYLVRLAGLDPAAVAAAPGGLDRLWTTLLDAGVDLIAVDSVAALGDRPS
jgi:endonuclease/exonuclease/phosphatase family metal-dependent hydrolase